MKNQTRKIISFLLVLVQLIALFPLGMTTAKAESTAAGQTPLLNETVVGTLKFQSFNLLGSNSDDRDKYYNGVDYTSTFYYSDDYFSSYANNTALENTTTATHEWHELENQPLATLSAAFAFASFTSNEGNCVTRGGYSWNNTNYSNKDSNAKSFFEQCGFAARGSKYRQYEYLNAPGMDTIGCVISSKTITVWDAETGTNKPYTLVAVGVRGAGYGAEWANNVTIGNPNNNAHEMINGRHWGFETSAQTVCSRVQDYLSTNHITGDVKYWVTGFSRAAAVANLVAQKLTDNTGYAYGGSKQNVYGYTWECPQAASTIGENALYYTNIHNIINPMDAVPKVSPDEFQHQRLGIDYRMPYYGNTSTTQNTDLYNRMYETLKTIAVGTTINGTFKEDPLIKAVDPNNYPYNRTLPVYQITAWQLMRDAFNSKLTTNFGTEQVSGSDNKIGNKRLDVFIDNLIDVFLTSSAWTDGSSNKKVPVLTNRNAFINNYQADFRTLLGYLLDFSGPAFLDMVDNLMSAVQAQIKPSNLFSLGGIFLSYSRFANNPYGSSILGNPYRVSFANDAKELAVDVVNTMTSGYSRSRDGITQSQMKAALQRLVVLVVDLYAYELYAYNGNYLGTCAHWLNEILSTHEQETVLSWIMSLDENHMNRSCRTVMVPRASSAELHLYRPDYLAYDGDPEEDVVSTAPVVASWNNGAWSTKDDRISYSTSGDYIFIRYPASMEIRTDITASTGLNLNQVAMDDYMTTSETVNVSAGKGQFTSALPSSGSSDASGYRYITLDSARTNANSQNSLLDAYGAISAGDTLHVIVNGTEKYNDRSTYTLIVDKAPTTAIAEYGKTDAGLSTGESQTGAVLLGGTSSSATEQMLRGIRTRQTVTTVPASSIYYDDELTGNSASGYASDTTRIDSADEGRIIWYKFRGTRIDVYCTTDSNTGYVMAAITDENGEIITVNGQRMITTMKSASEKPHYNVPTISFDGLAPNEDHYLKIFALKDSNYHLDGIRVYHAADETDSAVKAAYEAAGEQNACYRNLRDLLVNNKSTYKADGGTDHGILYVDDSSRIAVTQPMTNPDGTPKIDEETGEQVTQRVYENDYVGYQKNSPKNEIYLDQNQGIVFTISGMNQLDAGTKIMIGLSTAQGETASVTDIDGGSVSSALDSYYTLYTIPAAGKPTSKTFTIVNNTQGAIVSVTNLKIAGNGKPVTIRDEDLAVTLSVNDAAEEAVELQLVVNQSTLEAAADALFGAPEQPTPEVTPEPTPEPTADPGSTISQLISSFIQSLFGSISRMFGH